MSDHFKYVKQRLIQNKEELDLWVVKELNIVFNPKKKMPKTRRSGQTFEVSRVNQLKLSEAKGH